MKWLRWTPAPRSSSPTWFFGQTLLSLPPHCNETLRPWRESNEPLERGQQKSRRSGPSHHAGHWFSQCRQSAWMHQPGDKRKACMYAQTQPFTHTLQSPLVWCFSSMVHFKGLPGAFKGFIYWLCDLGQNSVTSLGLSFLFSNLVSIAVMKQDKWSLSPSSSPPLAQWLSGWMWLNATRGSAGGELRVRWTIR